MSFDGSRSEDIDEWEFVQGLSELPAEVFAAVFRGEESSLIGDDYYSIDKAWLGFHIVFAAGGPPLSLAITGDCRHPLSPHSLEEFRDGGHEWYLGLASPQLVQEAAAVLDALSTHQLNEWYEAKDCGGYDPDFHFFESLKAAYVNAAKRGNALIITVA